MVPESRRWNGGTDKKGNVERREVKEKRMEKRGKAKKAEKAIEGRKTNIKEKKQLSKVDGVVLFLR